jgi:hypothetical protein
MAGAHKIRAWRGRQARGILGTCGAGFVGLCSQSPGASCSLFAGGIFGEFFIEWARESDWYVNPSERVHAAMSVFSSFVTQPWFVSVTMLVAGLAIGAWADAIFRRKEQATMSSAQDDLHEQTADTTNPSVVTSALPDNNANHIDKENEEAHPASLDNFKRAAQERDLSPEYKDLLAFFLDHLEPVASAQWALQGRLLSVGVENDKVRSLALQKSSENRFLQQFFFCCHPPWF